MEVVSASRACMSFESSSSLIRTLIACDNFEDIATVQVHVLIHHFYFLFIVLHSFVHLKNLIPIVMNVGIIFQMFLLSITIWEITSEKFGVHSLERHHSFIPESFHYILLTSGMDVVWILSCLLYSVLHQYYYFWFFFCLTSKAGHHIFLNIPLYLAKFLSRNFWLRLKFSHSSVIRSLIDSTFCCVKVFVLFITYLMVPDRITFCYFYLFIIYRYYLFQLTSIFIV